MSIKTSVLKQVRKRNYLDRDFDGLRSELLRYANLYYRDRISDFSENSLGGLFLDMAAYVGDNLSFYLDHQFNELDSELAIEAVNLQKHLNKSGVKITGDSPSIVDCVFSINVQSGTDLVTGRNVPQQASLPILRAGTVIQSTSGVIFELLNDIDFSETDQDGNYVAQITGTSGTNMTLTRSARCISGKQENFSVNFDSFVPFRKIRLPLNNVSEILSVTDSDGNVYYEVNDLSEDAVYVAESNTEDDFKEVPGVMKLVSAPYRFTTQVDIVSRETILTFGGGDASSFEDDIVPDPSEFAISLPNSKTFPRISLNPNDLLKTKTLGVTGSNVKVKIVYRAGGGLSHNVGSRTINKILNLKIFFPFRPPTSIIKQVTSSLIVTNPEPASGGENAPTIEELRSMIPSMKNSQQRIVTKEDLLSRIYTIPTKFGKVFRASVGTNNNNPFSTMLYIVSRDKNGKLIKSSDSLKRNLARYLNEYRLISDAIDILDCPILNFSIEYRVSLDPRLNSTIINQNIKIAIEDYFNVSKLQINKPINSSELFQSILEIEGVNSIPKDGLKFRPLYGTVNGKKYSNYIHDMEISEIKGMIYPPDGGIFELKNPMVDIIQGVI